MALLNTSGKIKMLRVNEVGDRFGPAADFIQAEVRREFARVCDTFPVLDPKP